MSRLIAIALSLVLALSCSENTSQEKNRDRKEIVSKELQAILDSAQVNGALLIFDFTDHIFYSNRFEEAKKSVIPASTYKIPHSIIGLETGILKNEETIFKWDGTERALSIWEKDLSLKEAFQKSCVPCYQELARKIGAKRMNKYLGQLSFGRMDVHDDNIDNFWLIGQSNINSFQQIDFLKRLYHDELTISKSTSSIVKNILRIEKNETYILSGKTGLGIHPNGDIGWFVGYFEKGSKVYFFASRISPKNKDLPRDQFINTRKKVIISALKKLRIMDT